jgi:hypothetical protein
VAGGDVCECGYLYVHTEGKVYTQRGEGWENAPNIALHLVTLEEEPEAFIGEPLPKKKDD